MAFLLTNTLCIPGMQVAAVPRRSLLVARATAARSSEHRGEPAVSSSGDSSGGRRRAMMLLAAATTVTAASSSARAAQKVGACEDIKTMSPYVEEIGNWAVTAFNELTDEKLKFRGVVRGCKQVVAGTNYELDVETEGPASASYLSGSYLVKVFDPLPSSTEGRQLKKFVKVLL